MSLHIVADENIPMVEDLFGPDARVTRVAGRSLSREQLVDAQVLLVRSVTRVDADLLIGAPVRFVGTATSGTDHVDREYLSDAGIGFAHAPGANANSVVEYVLAAIAAVDDCLEGLLAGGRAGVVGYGTIGKAVAGRLRALGIDCVIYDPWLEADDVPGSAPLAEVLSCEVVCLHPELTHASPWPSYHLLGEQELAQLGTGQLLINASRGPVVDNQALLRRLQEASAPAVVLDVWEHEPLVPADLLALVGLGTAHIAGYSYDGKILATRMLHYAVQKYFHADLEVKLSPITAPLPTLELGQPRSRAQALRDLICSCYRIEDDDHSLREALLDATEEQACANFDLLRKQYRRRRELAGRDVLLNSQNTEWQELVRALGCQPRLVG